MTEQKNSPAEAGQEKIIPINNISYKDRIMQEALFYAENGLNIVPQASVTTDGSCTCYRGKECKALGKHPIIKDWVNQATTNKDIIKVWFDKFSQVNIGIATGERNRIIVLDVDVRHNGDKRLIELEERLGKLPKTPTVISGGGGFHLYFQYSKDFNINNQSGRIANGIDIKSDGGVITAPPSLHHSGMEYKWQEGLKLGEVELAQLPKNWLEFISSHGNTVSQNQPELEEKISEGNRNDVMFRLACSLRVKGLTEDEVLCTLREVNQNRCVPTLDDDEISNIVKSSIKYQQGKLNNENISIQKTKGINAVDLLNLEMPEISWVIKNLFSTGLHIIAGKPKVGKSWLVLMLGIKVAVGSKLWNEFNAEKGAVLYLALEDNLRRLKSRLQMILMGERAPKNLFFFTEWKNADNGGLDDLEKWIIDHEDVKLVVIDTLQKVRGKQRNNSNIYADDYAIISSLKAIADKYNIAVVVVHHQRKMSSDDVFDTVSGSLGLTGGSDSVFVLTKQQRGNTDAILHMVGRDIEEREIALSFDKYTSSWHMLGNADEYKISKERQDIISLLRSSNTTMTPKQIAQCLGKSEGSIRYLLIQMVNSNEIKQISRGVYSIDNNTNITNYDNNTNFANNPNNPNFGIYYNEFIEQSLYEF